MDFNTLVKTKLFLLIIFLLPLSGILGDFVARLMKKKETLGWRIDIMDTPIDIITGFLPVLYLLVYGMMSLRRIHTDLLFSKLQLSSILISTALFSFTTIDFKIILIAEGVSFLLFITNIFVSFKHRNVMVQ